MSTPAPTVNPAQAAFVLDRTSDVTRTSQGATVSVIYKGPNDAATKAAFYAALVWGTAHGVYTDSVLSETSEKPIAGSGNVTGMAEITLTYKPDNTSASGVLGLMRTGDSTLESDSSAIEQPIETAPPEWIRSGGTQATWTATGLAALQLASPGIEGWIDPQPTVTRTDAVESSAFSFTESEITGDVGKVMTSAAMGAWGVASASSGKWLYNGKRIVKNGETVTIARTAQYNRQGWETTYVYRSDGSETPENP